MAFHWGRNTVPQNDLINHHPSFPLACAGLIASLPTFEDTVSVDTALSFGVDVDGSSEDRGFVRHQLTLRITRQCQSPEDVK